MKSVQKPGLQLLNTIFFNKYRLVEKLGEGTFGMIFKCESSDGLCAFKFEKKRYGRKSLLNTEARIMKELKGYGIPRIISYREEGDYPNDKLIYEGEFLDEERNGKGKEYDDGNIRFVGEY